MLVLKTAATLEPVTMDQVKMQLNLDTGTLADNLTAYQSMPLASHAIADNYTTHAGAGVSVIGKEAIVNLISGTNGAGGTNDTKIQESDDNAAFTDWTGGAFTQVTTLNDNATQEKEYTGTKAYIRTVSKVLVAACVFGTEIIVNEATAADEDLLTGLITTAREHVEDITRRALITQTWDYYLDAFPAGNAIIIPLGNLQTADLTVKYTDSDGTETTMTLTTDYLIETNGDMYGRIVLPYGESWPSFTPYPSNPIEIEFVCGWTTQALVPYRIKAAILMLIAKLYESRGEDVIGQSVYEDKTVMSLLASLRMWREF